jgi:predicted DNA-binding antitoxin AbrB/MazE fold protein
MIVPNTIECVYESGVLRPLHEVDFRDGERLLLRVERFDISKFYVAFGEGSMDEFETFEEESNDSEVVKLLPIEENTEIGSPVRKTKGLIKLDLAIAREIADSDE